MNKSRSFVFAAVGGVFIVGGIIIGFVLARSMQQEQAPGFSLEARISPDLLKNPLFSNWVGEVEGTVISKTENSFVLEKNGSTLTLQYVSGETIFKKASASFGDPLKGEFILEEVSFNDVAPGITVRGPIAFRTGAATGQQAVALSMGIIQ